MTGTGQRCYVKLRNQNNTKGTFLCYVRFYFTVCFAVYVCSTRGEKSCQWVTKSGQDGGFEFELSHSLLPYAEETTKLVVAAQAMDNLSFLKGKITFYLRDIGKLTKRESHSRLSTVDYHSFRQA